MRSMRVRAGILLGALVLPLAACAPQPYTVYEQPVARAGRVESVRQVVANPETSGLGAVTGAVVGGAIGSTIGGGAGRTTAIVLGALGGGLVGNEIEKKNPQMVWEVVVRYDDGTFATVRQVQPPGVRPGDRVRVTGTGLELLGR